MKPTAQSTNNQAATLSYCWNHQGEKGKEGKMEQS
jgi:hypothetical protein